MSSNLTLEDIDHIKALVDQINRRATEYYLDNTQGKAEWLGSAVAQAKEFLNGYAAALKHMEKKGVA